MVSRLLQEQGSDLSIGDYETKIRAETINQWLETVKFLEKVLASALQAPLSGAGLPYLARHLVQTLVAARYYTRLGEENSGESVESTSVSTLEIVAQAHMSMLVCLFPFLPKEDCDVDGQALLEYLSPEPPNSYSPLMLYSRYRGLRDDRNSPECITVY